MRIARARPLVLLVACSACGRACTCSEGETVYEHIDKPVRVELVREAATGHGRGAIGPIASFVLRVHVEPPFDEPVRCTAVDLAENEEGTIVAFRCQVHGERWRAIRLGGGGRHVLDCSGDLGAGAKPDRSKVVPLADAAPGIVECHDRGDGTPGRATTDLYATLADELRASGGDAAVRAWLAKTEDATIHDVASIEDAWMTEVARLPLARRSELEKDLCPALADASKQGAYVRAARMCAPWDAHAADAALDRVRLGFANTDADAGASSKRERHDTPLEWATLVALAHHGAEVGRIACAFAGAADAGDWRRTIAWAAIAATGTRCAAAGDALSRGRCGNEFDCDAGLCSESEARIAVEAWRASGEPDGGIRAPGPTPPAEARALLAAGYADGALPHDFVLRNARRHYEIAGDAGEACAAAQGYESTRCEIPVDGGALVSLGCVLRADDRRHRVRVSEADAGR